jgi:hypothetical protein
MATRRVSQGRAKRLGQGAAKKAKTPKRVPKGIKKNIRGAYRLRGGRA